MTNDIQIATISAADLPARGERLAQGTFVGRYWIGDQERALVLLDDEFAGAWGESGKEVETGWYDGIASTKSMAEAGSEIAKKALELGGHIPSPIEAGLLMGAKQEGLIRLSEERFYWLSGQYSSDNAYGIDFGDCWQDYGAKHYERLVRLVRTLIIH